MEELQDIETERRVLGQMIVEPNAYLKINDILSASDFYKKEHSEAYEAIENLFKNNTPIDISAVIFQLKKQESNISAFEVTKFTEGIAAASHLEYHARIIKEYSIRRVLAKEIMRLYQIGTDTSYDMDYFTDRAAMLGDLAINEVENRSQIKDFKKNVHETIESIRERQQHTDTPNFGVIPSLRAIREFIPLWENGSLIIIAARPSMGKTAFVLHEAVHIASTAGPVLFFSLEMTARKLTTRILQRESGLTGYDLDRLTADQWGKLDEAVPRIQELGLFIDDTPAVSIGHIKAKAKIFKKQHDIKAIVVDYLGLMKADKGIPREQAVAEISKTMKQIAKEFDMPVFLLSQLNRGPEAREKDGFKPKLSDLRESGAIEQDADIVIFPHRPIYYNPNNPDYENKAYLYFAKNRDGKMGASVTQTNETITKFYDIINASDDITPY
jgi:replicative DNA helicase